MTAKHMLDAFDAWSNAGQPLVLASVYETSGSTYSKAGAQLVINPDGDFHGMLSGGCLEGDLLQRAGTVLTGGKPQTVTYDLGQNDEELWGLGVGCDGLMRIFLQPLDAGRGYEPFASMAGVLRSGRRDGAAIVIESDGIAALPGAAAVRAGGAVRFSDMPAELLAAVSDRLSAVAAGGESFCASVLVGGAPVKCLFVGLKPPPAVLVLGAGLDAVPVVRLAAALGWRVTLQDHRPSYVENGDFEGAEAVHCLPVADLSKSVSLDRFDAVIVMSHHLASDRSYLRQLAATDIPYIGLLGPAERRRRLLDELGEVAARLGDRVHGPAGIHLGGRGPAVIALSIVAEMQRELHAARRD